MSCWSVIASTWFSAATGEIVPDMSAVGKSVTAWFDASAIGDPMAVTATWTGDDSPVGVIGLESSNDPGATVTDDGDAVDLSGLFAEGEEPNPAGEAGRKSLLTVQPAARFRFSYTRTSGGEGATCVVRCAGNYR